MGKGLYAENNMESREQNREYESLNLAKQYFYWEVIWIILNK